MTVGRIPDGYPDDIDAALAENARRMRDWLQRHGHDTTLMSDELVWHTCERILLDAGWVLP